jgi:3-oxoacyl-[acyl-carrier protein] reductase
MAGKTAFVTGASRGIGRAAAIRLARLGFDVIAHHRAADADFADLRAAAAGHGTEVRAVQADFADPQAVRGLIRQVRDAAAGRSIDLAFLNAGIAPFGNFQELGADALRDLFQANTVAPYELAAGLAELVTAPGGKYIFTGSALTRYSFPALTGYGMSKIALEYLARNMAAELGARGITVNVIAPGVVDTDINAGWLRGNPDAADSTREGNAVKKLALPDDMAEVVGLLAQDASQAITGQVIDASMGSNL